ncbi:MAG: FAD:protein FMN transferase [Gemmataceae bacterium]|nr:FAD:protein FMN transferase [Gemmataceae bacterium]
MNRRRFLRRPPVPVAVLPGLPDEPPPPAEFALVRVSRRAMATRFEVALPYGTANAIPAAEAALDLIDDLEDQLTVYRDHSEVSRLNAAAAAGPVVVEARLFGLLEACAGWTRETEGAFDIATGALIKAWGFYSREGRVPAARDRNAAMARTGMRHVILNPEARSVKYRVPGLEINLGAVGKGYALDRAADLLRTDWGIGSALLHGGGSSVYAIGHPPGEPRGWPVRLRHPNREDEGIGTVWLRDRGLGVSAATFQHFDYNGRKLGHLLDPRTGWPAEGTAAAAVTAPTAAEADALSTAVFVSGAAGADALTRTRPHLGAVVLPETPPPNPLPRGERGDRSRQRFGSSSPSLPRGGGRGEGSNDRYPDGAGGWGPRTFNLSPAEYTAD